MGDLGLRASSNDCAFSIGHEARRVNGKWRRAGGASPGPTFRRGRFRGTMRCASAERQGLGWFAMVREIAICYIHEFARLPDLAKARVTEGCGEAELLEHLRSPEPHARGCWPVDFPIGKA